MEKVKEPRMYSRVDNIVMILNIRNLKEIGGNF